MLDLPPEGGPSSSSRRLPTSEPARGGLEVVDHPLDRVVDAEQLVLEQLQRKRPWLSSKPSARIMSHMYWWLVRAMPRASAGKICSRKLAKVPAQCAARCSLVNSLSEFRRFDLRSSRVDRGLTG